MDAFERIVCLEKKGIYESNYLKANSPDGRRGLWIKHNLLRPQEGVGVAEFWAVLFERDSPPVVAKRELPYDRVELSSELVGLRAEGVVLENKRAHGSLADLRWELSLTGGQPPLFHYPYGWLYTGGFPKKKLITPCPNLRFDGAVHVGGTRWEIDGWVGLRGHNWGSEHAWSYAYGNCNLWDDGARDRTVDGFTARVKVGPVISPWLSSLVARDPDVRLNHPARWLGAGTVTPERWTLAWPGRRTALTMEADRHAYAGLRYPHPDGRVSYCYNTKFARVGFEHAGSTHTSSCGELEVLFADPLAGIPLHPSGDWDPAAGDYRSPA